MRHRKAKRKLSGRTGSHRRAMYSNMLAALVQHGRIETTERKARELRGIAERTITRATGLGDALLKKPESLDTEDRARVIHAVRMIRRTLRDRDAALYLMREVAPRFLGRPGGYTRTFKLGHRRGDGAPMALIEFVPADMPESEWAKGEPVKEEKAGILGRLRKKKA